MIVFKLASYDLPDSLINEAPGEKVPALLCWGSAAG